MTETINIAHAEVPEILAWLAELRVGCGEDLCYCTSPNLAFLWASTRCTVRAGRMNLDVHGWNCLCNGSGRVPRAVGLEELYKHGIYSVTKYAPDRYGAIHDSDIHILAGEGETPTLAALRAVAESAKRHVKAKG